MKPLLILLLCCVAISAHSQDSNGMALYRQSSAPVEAKVIQVLHYHKHRATLLALDTHTNDTVIIKYHWYGIIPREFFMWKLFVVRPGKWGRGSKTIKK